MMLRINLKQIIIALISIIPSIILAFALFYFASWLHEIGHGLARFIDIYIKNGTIPNIQFTFINFPLFPILKVPIGTIIIGDSVTPIQIFAGPIFVMLSMSIITYIFYKFVFSNRIVFFIPLYFVFLGLLVEILCGTDNLTSTPHPICNQNALIHFIWVNFGIFLLIICFLIVYIFINENISNNKLFFNLNEWLDKNC